MKYVLIVILDQAGNNVLLMHKKKGPECTINKFNCPGGKVERHENYEAAAIRELYEETFITRNKLTEVLRERYPYGTTLAVFCTQLVDNEQYVQVEDEPLAWWGIDALVDVTNSSLAGYGNLPYFIHYAKRLLSL